MGRGSGAAVRIRLSGFGANDGHDLMKKRLAWGIWRRIDGWLTAEWPRIIPSSMNIPVPLHVASKCLLLTFALVQVFRLT